MTYVFFVAVLNVGLGFALAVYLGRRYQSLVGDGESWFIEPTAASPTGNAQQQVELQTSATEAAPPDVPLQDPAAQEDDMVAQEDEMAAPALAPVPPQPEAADQEASPPQSTGEKSPCEASIDNLLEGVNEYEEKLTAADETLRQYADSPEADEIEKVLGSLMEATQEYLDRRNQAYAVWEELHQERPELDEVHKRLQAAGQWQQEQIESTNQRIQGFDHEDGLQEGCRQVIAETNELSGVNHQVRDTLDQALAEVCRSERRLAESDPAAWMDRLTGVANRAGFEKKLFEWWENDPHRVRRLSVAMVDLDRIGQVNADHGQTAGNKIIKATAQVLVAESRSESTVARLSGQRFVYLLPDADSRDATAVAERVRQVIALTKFHSRRGDVVVTVSCGVAEAVAADTSETLLQRVEAAVYEAKRYGRNRTFVHEGRFPTPVVPPNFSLQEREITI